MLSLVRRVLQANVVQAFLCTLAFIVCVLALWKILHGYEGSGTARVLADIPRVSTYLPDWEQTVLCNGDVKYYYRITMRGIHVVASGTTSLRRLVTFSKRHGLRFIERGHSLAWWPELPEDMRIDFADKDACVVGVTENLGRVQLRYRHEDQAFLLNVHRALDGF